MYKIKLMAENNIRLKKEYKLSPLSKNFKVVFGTVNRISPSVIYLKLSTWVKYNGEIKEYNKDISYLNSNIKISVRNEIRNAQNFTDMFFYSPNIKKILANNDNCFHACFEITIKQREPILHEISLLNNKLKIFSDNLISIIEKNHRFEFSIKK